MEPDTSVWRLIEWKDATRVLCWGYRPQHPQHHAQMADNREATLEDLAYQCLSLLDLQVYLWKPLRRKENGLNLSEETSRSRKEEKKTSYDGYPNTGTRRNCINRLIWWRSRGHRLLTPSIQSRRQVVMNSVRRQWTAAPTAGFFYSFNHVTSLCRNRKKHSQFIKALNRNYEARFGIEGNHRRQTQYSASYHSRCLRESQAYKKNTVTKITIFLTCDLRHIQVRGGTDHIHTPDGLFRQQCIPPGTPAIQWS